MQKRLIILIVFILNIYIMPQTVQYGIFSGGSNNLLIKVQTDASVNYTTSNYVTNLVFTVIWSTSYNVSLGTPSGSYNVVKTGADPGTSVPYNYQKFVLSGGSPFTLPENWSASSQYTIASIPINGASSGSGTFELASDGVISGGDALLAIDLSSVLNSTKFFNSSVDAPWPVELTSFSASVNINNVNLQWKTATEVNNNGFEVERKTDAENSSWAKIGFVEGHGNSNSPKEYTYTDKSITGGTKFIYRLKQIDNDGKYQYSKEIEVEVVPAKYELNQNYPNPFNPSTEIKYNLPEASRVTLNVYNIIGQQVASLVNGTVEAGYHSVTFSGRDLPSGTYIYRLQTNNFVQTKKMVLLK